MSKNQSDSVTENRGTENRGTKNYEKGTSPNDVNVNKKTGFFREGPVSLAIVDQWFDEKILPMRRTDWFCGNPFALVSNPNGVCSQATQFVFDKYLNDFVSTVTTDGYMMGQIVWTRFEDFSPGFFNNHTAAIMIKKDKINSDKSYLHKYELINGKLYAMMEGNPQYSEQELLQLHVYDLFKKRRVTLKEWVDMQESFGSKHGGCNWIKLGTFGEINGV